jgi:hypothetical protein
MTTPVEESSPLRLLALPVLLSLIEGERTRNDIARQTGLSISKVNSIIEELQNRRLIVETTPLNHDQFVEQRFQIADGETAMATLTNELSENPIPYILSILDAVRYDLPKTVLQGTKAYAWYSRLVLSPEIADRLVKQVVQMLADFEELQKPEASEKLQKPNTDKEQPIVSPTSAARNHYRLSITLYQVKSDGAHE